MLAKNFGVAEKFGYAFDHRHNLIPADEGVEARSEVRLGRKATGHTERESDFWLAV